MAASFGSTEMLTMDARTTVVAPGGSCAICGDSGNWIPCPAPKDWGGGGRKLPATATTGIAKARTPTVGTAKRRVAATLLIAPALCPVFRITSGATPVARCGQGSDGTGAASSGLRPLRGSLWPNRGRPTDHH